MVNYIEGPIINFVYIRAYTKDQVISVKRSRKINPPFVAVYLNHIVFKSR